MRITVRLAACALLALPAACAGTQQVDSSPPTVTYSYRSQSDLDAAAAKADRYCYEGYGLRAALVQRQRGSGGDEAIFACQ